VKRNPIFLLPVVGVLLLAAVRWAPGAAAGPGARQAAAPDDLCPCGSGRKHKNCHGKTSQGRTAALAAFDYLPYARAAGAFLLMLAIALVVIELVYGFHGGIQRYIEGLRLVNADHDPDYLTFLGGQMRYRFESYFAEAYLLKEPVAAIVLAALGIFQLLRARSIGILAKLFLLLPPAVLFMAHTLFADCLGIRYIIGVLPFTCLFGGLALASLVRSGSTVKRCAAGVLCAWSIVAAAGIYPDQLSYFNETACLGEPGKIGLDGGSGCGTRWLDDSNVDWGQGLKQLSDWTEANAKGRPIRLAYFGSFPPEVYGFPPQSESLTSRDLMQVPAPGLYAVSVLLAFAELAVVIGDLVLVALRHFLAAGTAHAARAVGVFHLAAEFHFDLLDAAHQGGLYARGQQRIVGVGVGIEALHVADQALQVLDHGGIVALRLLLQLAEGLERLRVVVLEVLGTDGAVARFAVAVPGTAVRVAVTGAAAIAAAGVGGLPSLPPAAMDCCTCFNWSRNSFRPCVIMDSDITA
jgi:hypothetical protein